MFNWFRKNPNKDPRVVLEQALFDFGAGYLIPQALGFYDNRSTFEDFVDNNNEEVPWVGDNYEPKPQEVAYEIFYYLLNSTQRIGYIDWADGFECIVDVFTKLLHEIKAKPFSEEELEVFKEKAINAQRGEAFMKLYDDLDSAITKRGFTLTSFYLGGDAHHPIILTKEVYKRWSSAKFGKGFPVIP